MNEKGNGWYSRASLRYRSMVIAILYGVTVWLTDAYFLGDTVWYAQSIASGGVDLWEPGHLLWRPLGWLLWKAFVQPFGVAGGTEAQIIVTLLAINFVAGLAAVLGFHALLGRLFDKPLVVAGITVGFIFSQGFLNYVQSGSAYAVALSALIVGMYFLIVKPLRAASPVYNGIAAGIALALAVGMWLPFTLAIPAALLAPLFLCGTQREVRKSIFSAAVIFGLLITCAYTAVAIHLGFTNLTAFGTWISEGSHDITLGGLPRMALGFPRSFINIGDDGILFKRFLIKDTYNPVSLSDLIIRPSLMVIAVFYALLGGVLLNLLFARRGRQFLAVFLLGCLPVLAFAVYWQGGDLERYLALYPFLFLALAYSLTNWRLPRILKYAVVLYFVVQVAVNVGAMNVATLQGFQSVQVARVGEVLPLLKPNSMIFTLNQQDDLYQVNHSFPLNPTLQPYGIFTDEVIGLQWPGDFSTKVLNIWQAGGDVWVSKRLLRSRPEASWYWADGSNRGIAWQEVYAYFQSLEWGQSASGDDSFVLLASSPANRQILQKSVEQK